jgi:hypothetical protein
VIFVFYIFINLPVPGPGEAYYLTKAKHYWDPAWVHGDFFLESASTHQFFYLTWGWLTCFFDLQTTSILGRISSMAIVAWGLTRFVSRFCHALSAVLTANCLFLALQSCVDLADEWVIGGFEAKVLAFGLIFLAWSYLLERKIFTASMILGFAINTHVVVGGWALLLTLASLVCITIQTKKLVSCWEIFLFTIASTITASPGLISTVNALSLPDQELTAIGILTKDQLQFHANYLLVIHRLHHHLDPGRWQLYAIISYCIMFTIGVTASYRTALLQHTHAQLSPWKFAFWLSWGCMTLLLIGYFLGYRTGDVVQMPGLAWRLNLLKFYWFRVPDIWIPLVCAITISTWLSLQSFSKPLICLVIVTSLVISFTVREHPGHEFNQTQKQAWLETCSWIKNHTTSDKVFITPKLAWSFTWFTERKEYASFKNCPQDAVSLVEWNYRLKLTDDWLERITKAQQVTETNITELQQKTKADFIITWGKFPNVHPASYQNDFFTVYSLH